MYVIAILCFIKIYQFRHPDVASNAYKVFLGVGVVMLLEVFGIFYESTLFWTSLLLMYFLAAILLSIIIFLLFTSVIYNSYILPNNVTSDSHFLRYDFTEKMLDALGIKDSTGVIYELINYRYFTEDVLGTWDLMIDGMVNVRFPNSSYLLL